MKKGLGPNDEKAMRIAYLIAGFLSQTLTPPEHEELDRWVEESDENMMLFEELTDEKNIEQGMAEMQKADSHAAFKRTRSKIQFAEKPLLKRFWPYAVAASVLIAIAGLYFFKTFDKMKDQPIISRLQAVDMDPGTHKAVLILEDGTRIDLDRAKNGSVAVQGNTQVIKKDGLLTYDSGQDMGIKQEVVYNTLTTPKGGQYGITLPDGTRVWLNAASSIYFPSAFNGKERTVEVIGEAYFEVAKDPEKPFHVKSSGQEITVLGTHFNLNGYEDQEFVRTTLLEGKIQLSTSRQSILLQPGEQVQRTTDGNLQLNSNVDLEEVMAWKENWFYFKDAAIRDIMKQLSRWYDAEIVYEGTVTHHFNGTISRNLPVSKVLKFLEGTGNVHFKIEGRKIKVMP